MRTTTVVIAAVAVLSGPIAAQEQKPVPKDSVRVSIPGCTKGYIFTAGRRTVDEPGSVSVPEGMHFRMNGPKKLMAEINDRAHGADEEGTVRTRRYRGRWRRTHRAGTWWARRQPGKSGRRSDQHRRRGLAPHRWPLSVAIADVVPKGDRLPARVQTYIESVVGVCAQDQAPLVSLILFGSAAKGGFSGDVSDVDLIIVVRDDASSATRRRLREAVASLETLHGLRSGTTPSSGSFQARVERAVGHGFSCFVCTRSDLISGDVARVLDLRATEKPFVDRIVFASIVASAVTVWGEDVLPGVPVPCVRRLDVFKALFGFSSQVFLSAITFPVLPDATKYAMGALKHSLHSCYFCYHGQTAALAEEVDFFRRFGGSRAFVDLLALRGEYRRSFGFVMRCLPALARLHLRTARENRFPLAAVRKS
jgi:predicted nucleotidyltransferase